MTSDRRPSLPISALLCTEFVGGAFRCDVPNVHRSYYGGDPESMVRQNQTVFINHSKRFDVR